MQIRSRRRLFNTNFWDSEDNRFCIRRNDKHFNSAFTEYMLTLNLLKQLVEPRFVSSMRIIIFRGTHKTQTSPDHVSWASVSDLVGIDVDLDSN